MRYQSSQNNKSNEQSFLGGSAERVLAVRSPSGHGAARARASPPKTLELLLRKQCRRIVIPESYRKVERRVAILGLERRVRVRLEQRVHDLRALGPAVAHRRPVKRIEAALPPAGRTTRGRRAARAAAAAQQQQHDNQARGSETACAPVP